MTTTNDVLPYMTCRGCGAYLRRRAAVLGPAMAAVLDRTGENAEKLLDRYMTGVHARHLKHDTHPVPAVEVTTDTLQITSLNQLVANPDAWHALRGWFNHHGIDDATVVTSESIVRHEYSIEYTAYVTDPAGHRLTRGGDPIRERINHLCAPSPWPVEVVQLAERTRA